MLAFTDIWNEENDFLRCSIQNSRCRAFGLVQASRFGSPLSKAISKNQSEIVKRNSRVLYLLPLIMTTVTLPSLILFLWSEIFQTRSFRYASELSPGPQSLAKDPLFAQCITELIIFKSRAELLMLCCLNIS